MIPFNPLDKSNLGASVASAMTALDPLPLSEIPNLPGAGIYALYYCGDFEPYQLMTKLNSGTSGMEYPVYVGKAIPKGGRTGIASENGEETFALRDRLSAHRRSIAATDNLSVEHFALRLLTVEPIFIPLGETMLITQTGPLWNRVVSGFGSNAPGIGRQAGKKSRWDTLHPGRAHSVALPDGSESAEQISQEAREYLRSRHQV